MGHRCSREADLGPVLLKPWLAPSLRTAQYYWLNDLISLACTGTVTFPS